MSNVFRSRQDCILNLHVTTHHARSYLFLYLPTSDYFEAINVSMCISKGQGLFSKDSLDTTIH